MMGHPKAGGRVKGTPNKKTQALHDICDARGMNPFEALLELTTDEHDVSIRLSALKEVCSYLYPKRKAIEMDLEVVAKKLEELTEDELISLAEEKIRQLKGES